MFNKCLCYSFKTFLRFWWAKITRIIRHNQLLSTKFGRSLQYVKNDLKCFGTEQAPVLSKKGGTFHSFHEEEIGELLAKIIARTARRQLDGRHLLFGEHLQYWTTLMIS